ncbi:MAG: carbohydrate kinase family protein [Candidatus Nanoarchaeia archaeon]|nr:carbohydrate kinase family protein [Candidatus Nanoarchaeia archaeon]
MDIITIGSATIDVFCKTQDQYIEIKSPEEVEKLIAFKLGSKLLINELNFMQGGGGTNTAFTFARMGLQTGYLGKVSDDANGDSILLNLAKEGIEFLGVVHKKDSLSWKNIKKMGEDPDSIKTGYSIILESMQSDRTILTHKGVNDYLFFDEIDKKILEVPNIYSSAMDKESLKTLVKIIKNFKGNFYFNPSEYMIKNHFEEVLYLISKTHVLILNREEAEAVLEKRVKRNGRLNKVLLKDYLTYEERKFLSNNLKELGAKNVIITDGTEEVLADVNGQDYFLKPHKSSNVVDTTGAGDSFASAFVGTYIKTLDVNLALKNALKNAESVIRYYGAKTGILSFK